MFNSFKFDPNTCKIYISMATAVFIYRMPARGHSPVAEAAIAVGMGAIVIQQSIKRVVGTRRQLLQLTVMQIPYNASKIQYK